MLHLADAMKCYRNVNNLSVRDTAARIGISASTLSRFERHNQGLSASALAKLLVWLLATRHRNNALH